MGAWRSAGGTAAASRPFASGDPGQRRQSSGPAIRAQRTLRLRRSRIASRISKASLHNEASHRHPQCRAGRSTAKTRRARGLNAAGADRRAAARRRRACAEAGRAAGGRSARRGDAAAPTPVAPMRPLSRSDRLQRAWLRFPPRRQLRRQRRRSRWLRRRASPDRGSIGLPPTGGCRPHCSFWYWVRSGFPPSKSAGRAPAAVTSVR